MSSLSRMIVKSTPSDLVDGLSRRPSGLIFGLAEAAHVQGLFEQCLSRCLDNRFDQLTMRRCAGRACARLYGIFRQTGDFPKLDAPIASAVLGPMAVPFLEGFFSESSACGDGEDIATQFRYSLFSLANWLGGETLEILDEAECLRRACEGLQMHGRHFQLLWWLQNRLGCSSSAGAALRKWCVLRGWTGNSRLLMLTKWLKSGQCPIPLYTPPSSWAAEVKLDEGVVLTLRGNQPTPEEVAKQLAPMYSQGVKTLVYGEGCNRDGYDGSRINIEMALYSYMLFPTEEEATGLSIEGTQGTCQDVAFQAGSILADWCEVFPPGKNAASIGILPIWPLLNPYGVLRESFMRGVAASARGNCVYAQDRGESARELTATVMAGMALRDGSKVQQRLGSPKASPEDCRPHGLPVQKFLETCVRPISEEKLFALLVSATGRVKCVVVAVASGSGASEEVSATKEVSTIEEASAIALVSMAKREGAVYLAVAHTLPCDKPQVTLRDIELALQIRQECERNGICPMPYLVIGNKETITAGTP